MKIKALFLRILLFHLTCLLTLVNTGDLSTKERIELQKAWLARRAGTLKTLKPADNDTALNRITYLRKLIKFNKNTNKPISENDVSYVPHNLSEEKDKLHNGSEVSNNNENDIYTVVSTSTHDTPVLEKDNYIKKNEVVKIVEVSTSTIKTEPTHTTPLDNHIPNYEPTTSTDVSVLETSTIEPENAIERVPEVEKKTGEKEEPEVIKADDLSVRSVFTSWSNWSLCSRSCGGGVKAQSRRCVKRTYLNGKKVSGIKATPSNECIGIYKRYHICNDHNCPEKDIDFRDQQCKGFNNKLFGGKRYLWEAYLKDDAECELNCKPIGMQYFATLNKTVIDGTTCTKPSEYFRRRDNGKAICVEGICKVPSSPTSGISTVTGGDIRVNPEDEPICTCCYDCCDWCSWLCDFFCSWFACIFGCCELANQ